VDWFIWLRIGSNEGLTMKSIQHSRLQQRRKIYFSFLMTVWLVAWHSKMSLCGLIHDFNYVVPRHCVHNAKKKK
jgi:hypothetical protein